MIADRDGPDVQRVLEGDLTAFEGIVERWQGPLINLAFRFCRDRGRAEDMAQEVFVKVFKSLRSYRGRSAFSTWMFAVATNLYRASLRRQAPPAVPLDAVAELADPHTAHGLLEDEDRREVVRRAVSSLPARYRDAVVLFYFFGMDLGAAARALDLPEGTVKARLHRGRGILHHKLSGLLPARLSTEEA